MDRRAFLPRLSREVEPVPAIPSQDVRRAHGGRPSSSPRAICGGVRAHMESRFTSPTSGWSPVTRLRASSKSTTGFDFSRFI